MEYLSTYTQKPARHLTDACPRNDDPVVPMKRRFLFFPSAPETTVANKEWIEKEWIGAVAAVSLVLCFFLLLRRRAAICTPQQQLFSQLSWGLSLPPSCETSTRVPGSS